jgi:von Willebrand factor type A domain
MGRHADPSARRVQVHPRLVIAAVATLVVLAGGITWWVTASGDGCDAPTTVRLTVAPELERVVDRLLADPRQVAADGCVRTAVTAQQPLQTVARLGALDAAALPEVWVPDSSLWATRVDGVPLAADGSMGSSPVVLATSSAAVDGLGWAGKPPTWAGALTGGHPVAVPDLASSAEVLTALAAVRASLGGGANADNAVVSAVLAAERGPALSPAAALDAGSAGAADAPLVPVTEQEVYARAHAGGDSGLVAVYPADGSPALDYPVLRVGSPSGARQDAVDAVVARLTSAAARERTLAAGFRDADGTAPPGGGTAIRAAAPAALAVDPADVRELLTRLTSLAEPSRILAVFDVSTSMRAPVGDSTRATLARDAAKSALTLIPGTSAIGLWDFAYRLDGDHDWSALVPTRRLDADVDGRPQREVLDTQLDTLPDRLAPGGTGLYDTTLAAVRAARADHDPAAVNSVLIVTDGTDEDNGGIGLQPLLAALRSEADPARPVKVIGVALGPDADVDVLRQIADATGGAAYSAEDPRDLQTVLFDALRQRG